MNREKRISVIAVGNPLRGDDGVGPAALERLRAAALPENVLLVDAGSDPLDVVRHLLDADKAVIIDAARLDAEPGRCAVFSPADLCAAPAGNPFSTHAYGLAEGFELVRALGAMPDVTVIGVQPQSTEPGQGLSPAVSASVPHIVNLVLEEVAS